MEVSLMKECFRPYDVTLIWVDKPVDLDFSLKNFERARELTYYDELIAVIDGEHAFEFFDAIEPQDDMLVIISETPVRLPKAFNDGYRASLGQYITLLSSDTIVQDKDWNLPLINLLKRYPKLGWVSAIQYATDTKREFYFHATASVITREVLETVGYYDEQFSPFYFEDDDYLMRMWQAGYFPASYHKVKVIHDQKKTSRIGFDDKEIYQRNLEKFYKKWGIPCSVLQGVLLL